MQAWITVDEDYLNYLRSFESKIPNSNYGADKMKPFFGVLFETDGLVYVTQVSHLKPRHVKMKDSVDFRKVYIPNANPNLPDRPVAVVNLNYMFPIPKALVTPLAYRDIDKCRTFSSNVERSKYVDLLIKEIASINKMGIERLARKVYELKSNYPDAVVSKRCFDFKGLEEKARAFQR